MKKQTLIKILLLLIPGMLLTGKIYAEDNNKTGNKEKSVKLLYIKKKFFEEFAYLIPGTTTEEYFLSKNQNLAPYDEDNNPDTNSLYVLQEELKESGYYYDKAILNFENGLLEWINLIPKDLSAVKFLETATTPYKKELVDENYDLYDFTGYILIVDKKTNLVQSIGIFKEGLKF